MSIIFSDGFDDYGLAPDQKFTISLNPGGKVTFGLTSGTHTVAYDLTLPRDGKYHAVTQLLMADENGVLYAKGPPEIAPDSGESS